MQRDTCYSCQKQGHWAKDCPETPNCNSSNTKATVINDQAIPANQCPCRAGVCIVRTARTKKNFMRKFYNCPGVLTGKDCGFFQWCDRESPGQRQYITVSPELQLVSSGQRQNILQSAYPECSCGAGVCKLLPSTKDGKDTGLKHFACPVKKGQGACNFFQWQHSPGKAASNDGHGTDESLNISSYNGIASRGSAEKGLENLISREHLLEEIVGSDFGLDDAQLPPIVDLTLSGMKTSIFAKPGRCYQCGKEGHWKEDCLEP